MNRIFTRLVGVGMVVALCMMGGARWVQAQEEDAQAGVTDSMLASAPASSWLHGNGNWAGHRHSLLTQLNPSNVGDLRVAWIFSTGGETDAQATPLYHDGVVYQAQDNTVFAVDARSGGRLWKYVHELPEDWGGQFADFFTGKHRNLAISGEYIYFLSNDTKVHAIHYKTGVAKFVQQYMHYPKAFDKSDDSNGYFGTAGPLAIPGQIIVPLNATDMGGLPGYVAGISPDDGAVLWQANMIPGPGEPGYESWPGDSRDYGGAGPWIVGTWDPDLRMYYTGTANAYPFNAVPRGNGKYDNVGAASVVAINTDTGKVPWRYTVVPGDPWDYDTMQTPLIITIDGRKTIVQPNKTGYIHYLDAATGQFLRAARFSDKINWAEGYDVEGRPLNQIALPEQGGETLEVWPSVFGGVNMYPAAYNPDSGMIFLPATNLGMMYGYEEVKVISNVRNLGATFEFLFDREDAYEVNLALNIKSGNEIWRDQKTKWGFAGGMLSTAGGLVFYTSQNADFQAVDAASGEILYAVNLGTTPKSGPITYMLDGKQYVVQAVGGVPGWGYEEHNLEHGNLIVALSR